MGLSLSLLFSAREQVASWFYGLLPNFPKHVELNFGTRSFKRTDSGIIMTNSVVSKKSGSKNSINLQNCKPDMVILDRSASFKHMLECSEKEPSRPISDNSNEEKKGGLELSPPEPIFFSPRPLSELQAAAVTVQKVYKSYRTRRNLADCAVVVEELWWKAIDSAALDHNSVSFYKDGKPETVVSRWARARKRVAKFAKGLAKDDKAQKLALQHWLEAIDPRHRYGHNLHLYYDKWFASESTEPFFYWLDVGQGKELVHEKCSRNTLSQQCIKYLGPNEREAYEVVVIDGRLIYKQKGEPVDTDEGSKWIFVLSTSRSLYVGQKKKGTFQHSSFLSGAATTAAGRLVAHDGVLEAIWPYSGHYHPTEENFKEFISFLEEHHVDLSNVKRGPIDDDTVNSEDSKCGSSVGRSESRESDSGYVTDTATALKKPAPFARPEVKVDRTGADALKKVFEFPAAAPLSAKWSTGAGPRIGCVRDYPTELQFRALEQVNLSPRVGSGPAAYYGPIPSPRPSPKIKVSPRLAYMGHPSPRKAAP